MEQIHNRLSDVKYISRTFSWRLLFVVTVFYVVKKSSTVISCPSSPPKPPPPPPPPTCAPPHVRCSYNLKCCSDDYICYQDPGDIIWRCRNADYLRTDRRLCRKLYFTCGLYVFPCCEKEHQCVFSHYDQNHRRNVGTCRQIISLTAASDEETCRPLGEQCGLTNAPCCGKDNQCVFKRYDQTQKKNLGICTRIIQTLVSLDMLPCAINQNLCLNNRGCCEDSGVCMSTSSMQDPYCRHPSMEAVMETCNEKNNVSCSYDMSCCGLIYKCNYHTYPRRVLCTKKY